MIIQFGNGVEDIVIDNGGGIFPPPPILCPMSAGGVLGSDCGSPVYNPPIGKIDVPIINEPIKTEIGFNPKILIWALVIYIIYTILF